MPKTGLSLFFDLQRAMKSILLDLNTVDMKVKDLERRYNPPKILPPPPPPKPVKRPPSPTRNYYPPGYTGQEQVEDA